MSSSTMRGGPEDLFTVTEAPRFVSHSGRVGWQGGFFTEVLTASAGRVDHVHELYCVQRTFDPFQVHRDSDKHWEQMSRTQASLA